MQFLHPLKPVLKRDKKSLNLRRKISVMGQSPTVEITPAQRAQWQELGYFITDVVFDEATLEPVRAAFHRLHQEMIEATAGSDALAREQARYRPFLGRIQQRNEVCDRFCRHPVFLDLCRQLLGPDADMTWDQAILKPPSPRENAFAWHQDMWYATRGEFAQGANPDILLRGDTALTCWVAVTRTIVDNGTLWVLPGRHKEGLLPHIWSEEKREHQGQFDTSWKIPVVMRAGQVLVFNKYLPHGSGANILDETRMAYQIGYSLPGLRPASSPDILPVLRNGAPAE
jgi:ectoine hydroxylase-related dioxygenase (phytanoyl-CoA dioxygenase family)